MSATTTATENTGSIYRKFWTSKEAHVKSKEEIEKRKESGPEIGNAYVLPIPHRIPYLPLHIRTMINSSTER